MKEIYCPWHGYNQPVIKTHTGLLCEQCYTHDRQKFMVKVFNERLSPKHLDECSGCVKCEP